MSWVELTYTAVLVSVTSAHRLPLQAIQPKQIQPDNALSTDWSRWMELTPMSAGGYCQTPSGSSCYMVGPEKFNKFCNAGDFCYHDTDRVSCPMPPETEPAAFGCIYKPLGLWAGTSARAPQEYLDYISGQGEWDCLRNTWRIEGHDQLNVFTEATVPRNYDAVLTYGDSLAHNIHIGLGMVAGGFKLTNWFHDRNDVSLDLPTEGAALAHFCCGWCACGRSPDESVQRIIQWLKHESEGRQRFRALIIVRVSMHIRNDHVKMAGEIDLLAKQVNAELRNTNTTMDITYLWIRQHGNGKLKPPQYLPEQSTISLRAYENNTLQILSTWQPDLAKHMLFLDVKNMAQAAENQCDNAYEMPDGTHLSLTLQVAAANMVFGLIQLLR
eukprot:CAMPEP_0168380046 /NCGR_PEP_ID=MMETSP0228-20121227/12156_1 /TAXON_ID=133427 /ORGANISM="Protoceratium reticulatum, Strain CCCM 535 (=CCMP 1889)" /LENGTH=383 /DNA_ID=CAMNT_0008393095 /DNA_START=37 /DNA_END=1188 /DNA_ORIENTATION=+